LSEFCDPYIEFDDDGHPVPFAIPSDAGNEAEPNTEQALDDALITTMKQANKALVGRFIRRSFGDDGTMYTGHIRSFDVDTKSGKVIYQVQYDDGDMEDMFLEDAIKYIVNYNTVIDDKTHVGIIDDGFVPDASVAPMCEAMTAIIAAAISTEKNTPGTYDHAMSGADSGKWKQSINTELAALTRLGTWEPAILPRGRSAIGTRWVFKIKRGPRGEIIKYKSRLVAKGYRQRAGIDVSDVFAPSLRLSTAFRSL